MANTKNTQEIRFRIIETLLLWEGEIDNQRLRSILGVQAVQASRILAEYASQYQQNLRRTSPRAPYEASPSLKPVFSSGSIDEYLNLLDQSERLKGIIEDARVDFSEPASQVFSSLLRACRHGRGIVIAYRSMNTPSSVGKERLIYPHAIVRAGRRWHVRAWCDKREGYRDFVLGRIQSAILDNSSRPKVRDKDADWNKTIELNITAHPELKPEQARIIREEYFNGAVSRRLNVRRCLLSYVIQDLRIAVDIKREIPPDFQLAASNVNSLKPHLFDAKPEDENK